VIWVSFWIVMLTTSFVVLSITGILVLSGTSLGLGFSSSDWSGYTVASNMLLPQPLVSAVSGSWIVPSVEVSKGDTFTAVWIGVGGQFDNSLIQVGTEQDSVNGQRSYSAWYEILPNYALGIETLTVSPGDKINASISLIDANTLLWSISIADLSTGQEYRNSLRYNSSRLTAEWIVERPTLNNSITNLANFSHVTFTNMNAVINNINGGVDKFSFSRLTMLDRQNNPLVSVSQYSPQKRSFSITFLRPN